MLHLGSTAHIFAVRTATGQFLQPWTSGSVKDYSDNNNYAVGVNIITEWVADFTNATIVLNQDNNPGDAQGGPSRVLQESYNKTTWGWTVSYEGINPAHNNVFYFAVTPANGTNGFTGHYFNISDASTTSSTTAALSTADSTSLFPTASTTSASSGLMKPQSTSPATVTVAPSSDGGMPVSIIAGMVVGIVAGSLLLVGGAWWAWKVKKRQNTASRAQAPNHASGQPYLYREQKPYEDDGNQIHELHDSVGRRVHELQESVPTPIHELHESVEQLRI